MLILIAAIVLTGCEDLLPEYSLPDDIFTLQVFRHDTTAFTFFDTDQNDTLAVYRFLTRQEYTLLVLYPAVYYGKYWSSPQLTFRTEFFLQNTYEETIQSKANIRGRFEIWPVKNPEAMYTADITNNIFEGIPQYSPATQEYTVDPGKRISFPIGWNFRFDNGKYLHQYASIPSSEPVSSFYSLHRYRPVPMRMRLSLGLSTSSKVYVVEKDFMVSLESNFFSPPDE